MNGAANPSSLSEGAGSPIGLTEGVSSDGCSGPTIYTPAHINSETFEPLRSPKYTPSVSHSLDSSIKEGAGDGCTIHPTARKPQRGGRFSSPRKLRGGEILPFNEIHSLSLAFARQLPQRGSRETPPFNRVLAKPWGWRAIFIAPTKLRIFHPLRIRSALPQRGIRERRMTRKKSHGPCKPWDFDYSIIVPSGWNRGSFSR